MHGFEWDNVRLLLTLLRATTTEQAAAQLEVDRSTISRRLALLEDDLGASLFVRTRDGLKPTGAALRLRPAAEAMELAARALASAATETGDRVTGTVRVATTVARVGVGLFASPGTSRRAVPSRPPQRSRRTISCSRRVSSRACPRAGGWRRARARASCFAPTR